MGNKDDILEMEILDTVNKKPNRGFLHIRFDRIQNNHMVNLQVQGINLKSKRFCGPNNNMLEIYKPKGVETIGSLIGSQTKDFDYIKSPIPESEWILVHRFEIVNKNESAVWSELAIQKSKLCNYNDDLPLLFKVMDYKTNNGNHKLVGGVILTFKEIETASTSKSTITIHKKNRANRGSIVFTKLVQGTL